MNAWSRQTWRRPSAAAALALLGVLAGADPAAAEETAGDYPPWERIEAFLDRTCLECHDDLTAEGGLDLLELPKDLAHPRWRAKWIQIFDRVEKGEMPPEDKPFPEAERGELLALLGDTLLQADREDLLTRGRGPLRRLTREEYEDNLRDLLRLPQLDIRDRLPEDRAAHGFTKGTATLDMSRVQLAAYLDAAEAALREAMAPGLAPEPAEEFRAGAAGLFPSAETFGGREAMFFARDGRMVPLDGARLKELREAAEPDPGLEMALFRSATWPYYGYPPGFRAKRDGAYRVRFAARAVRQARDFRLLPAREPLPMTFRARAPSGPDVSGDVRATGGLIDLLPEPGVHETVIQLKAGETFEYSLLGLPVPHPITSHGGPLYYDFPPMPEDGHRGAAFRWIEVTGPLAPESWPPASHRVLFGDLPLRAGGEGGLPVEVVAEEPGEDARRLFARFAPEAARRPVAEEDQTVFLALIAGKLEEGAPFAEAMLAGYQAFLSSAHFLYLPEPGREGGDHAIAARLSHFLWNSRPDEALTRLAAEGSLRRAATLRAETDRLIAGERFDRFVKNFAGQWLELRELRRDIPDLRLYPEYRKDDYLVESMEAETLAFVAAMARENLPATVLVDAPFAHVNDRLARHYDLAPVEGSAVRRVDLPESSPYGGLLTQAALLKVTANGTTTSPVVRGVWVMERLLGDPPPPPPPVVPAVEPDIRGATTIRELLARHTEVKSCAACHARFDPAGFALENFDVMGGWRDHYRGLERGQKITGIDRAGHAYEYRVSHPVDAAGQLASGEGFADVRELKAILAARPRQLARNLLSQLALYATGVSPRFSERAEIEAMLDRCEPGGYGFRDLIHELVASSLFLGESLESVTPEDPPLSGLSPSPP